jgi:tetratricopeptide (TPR) repeat protein
MSPKSPTGRLRQTYLFLWLSLAGAAKLFVGKDEDAAVLARRSIEANRNYPLVHFLLAATLAYLGRINEARAAAQAGLALNPSFTITRYRSVRPGDNPIYLAQFERLLDGMRKAGVPEG